MSSGRAKSNSSSLVNNSDPKVQIKSKIIKKQIKKRVRLTGMDGTRRPEQKAREFLAKKIGKEPCPSQADY